MTSQIAADSADQQLAHDLAAEAADLLVGLRTSGPSGWELGDLGDAQANELLLRRLAEARPDDTVLSEESADDPARLEADRVWIVDPVDGTREYGLDGRPDWAVHVALWERDADPARARLSAAAVALPALGIVLGTGRESVVAGSSYDAPGPGLLLPAREDARPRIVHSESRPPAFSHAVADAVDGVLTPLGSAGAKAAAVVLGEADAYIHAGGQHQWDSAAPAGVALAHGFAACRIDGAPLEYNGPGTYLPDLVVCRADLSEAILGAIADHAGE